MTDITMNLTLRPLTKDGKKEGREEGRENDIVSAKSFFHAQCVNF